MGAYYGDVPEDFARDMFLHAEQEYGNATENSVKQVAEEDARKKAQLFIQSFNPKEP